MLPIHLQSIKSSGIYRFTFDKSEVESQPAQIMRLVVGYSEKGPFNTPVYVKNATEFINIFGDSSKKFEKRGVYFHRLAKQCLSQGPILCLNLHNFETTTEGDDVNKVEGITLNPIHDNPISNSSISVKYIYNTSRFWSLDPEVLTGSIWGSNNKTAASYISVVSTDTSANSNTIIIRPSNVAGYDVTIRQWYNTYSTDEMPEYMSNYQDMLVSDFMVDVFVFKGQFTDVIASSDTFSQYFNINDKVVTLKDSITNAYGDKIDVLSALAATEGSGWIQTYTGSLLPYFKDMNGGYAAIDLIFNNDNSIHKMMMKINENLLETGSMNLDGINVSGLVKGTIDTNKLPVLDTNFISNYDLDIINFDSTYDDILSIKSVTPNISYIYSSDGTEIKETDSANFYGKLNMVGYIAKAAEATPSSGFVLYGNTITTTTEWAKKFAVGDTFLADSSASTTGEYAGLATITSISDISVVFDKTPLLYSTTSGSNITSYLFKVLTPKISLHGEKTLTYLKGYTYSNPISNVTASSMSEKSNWQNTMLSTLQVYNGLRLALTNDSELTYRYLIDTFESYIDSDLKSKFSSLAKEKGNVLAILNFPAMNTFISCNYTYFTDASGNFKTSYIPQGGNPSKARSVIFSLPTENDGASFAAFYTPLKFNDNGLKINVPSAGLVSNNFMVKYSSRQPYYIVAGPTYGKMIYGNLIGPDFNFSREDLDELEPFGCNCMVYKPQRGTYINSNQTAKQNPVTGLSKVNVRELVIYLQDNIADMLQGYQWEMNTQVLRANVKAKADAICAQVQTNGGLYNYSNQCDENNNTAEVIDNEMLILSTAIEPAKGAGKMVHELTIYRTGGMTSVVK